MHTAHISYDFVFVARLLNLTSTTVLSQSSLSDRSKITGLTGEMGTVVTGRAVFTGVDVSGESSVNKKPIRQEEFSSPAKLMNLHSLGSSSLL